MQGPILFVNMGNNKCIHLSLLVLFLLIKNGSSANIFCIFPTASFSHQQPQLALSHGLAERGHNLTVITTNPSKEPVKNHHEIDISFLYKEWDTLRAKTGVSLQKRHNPYNRIKELPKLFEFFTNKLLNSPQIQTLIREIKEERTTKYDVIIYESFFTPALLGFAEILGNPPLIGISTVHTLTKIDLEMGNPLISSYMPNIMLNYNHKMSFWERINNVIFTLYFEYIFRVYNSPVQEELMKKYFGSLKYKAEEMNTNKSLLIISTDVATGYPKPVNPNTIYVGPLHIKDSVKELPEDIKKWMDEAQDGVIYFSLGSNMKGTSVPEQKRSAFIKAFSKFPKVRVLWKWEADTKLSNQPDNVLVKKWLPQKSILAHPKVILFISQVGLQSLQEAVYFGVPILGIPMFGDQDFNTNKVLNSKAGLSLEFSDISFENVYRVLTELITDNASYKENMRGLSTITKDKPMSALDTAIWWVEYVIRHNGAPHLRPASLDLTWYEYYMLDIAVILITVSFIILIIIYKVLKLLFCKPNITKLKVN